MPRHRMPASMMKDNKRHYTKAEMKERKAKEIKGSDDNIVPAEFLPERLHQRFFDLIEEMNTWGVLSNVDSDALSQYILAIDKYGAVVKTMEAMDFVTSEYKNLSLLEKKYFEQTLKLQNVLGLNMISRMKLESKKEQTEEEVKSDEDILFGDALKLVK